MDTQVPGEVGTLAKSRTRSTAAVAKAHAAKATWIRRIRSALYGIGPTYKLCRSRYP